MILVQQILSVAYLKQNSIIYCFRIFTMLLLKAEMLIYCCVPKCIVNLNAKNRSKYLKNSTLFLLASIAIPRVLSLRFP